MSKKEFIEKMNNNAKAIFKADHIEFKEFKGYSVENFNYALHIANYNERNINIQYYYFDPLSIKAIPKNETDVSKILIQIIYPNNDLIIEEQKIQKIIQNILITPFTTRYLKGVE